MIAGAKERLQRRHKELGWLAWHTAALSRVKRMPRLDKLTGRAERQTPEQQKALIRMWMAAPVKGSRPN